MTIIEKHFKRKPTEKQLHSFIAEVIYDKENFPRYLQFRIYDEKISQ